MTHSKKKEKRNESKMGRPSDYDEEVIDKLCDLISTSSKGLHYIIKHNPGMPGFSTLQRWLLENRGNIRDKYAQAKRNQADFLVEEIIDIADDDSRDDIVNEDGKVICNSEWIGRSRLRVDTRKWVASKLFPKVYGNQLAKNEDDDSDSKADALRDLE